MVNFGQEELPFYFYFKSSHKKQLGLPMLHGMTISNNISNFSHHLRKSPLQQYKWHVNNNLDEI
jgi:hypothetical protein